MISQSRLRELVHYEPSTGIFTWVSPRRARAGSEDGKGYLRMKLDGRLYKCHRLAWLYVFGEWPTMEIDHIDGNRSNNAIANLRNVSRMTNLHNRRNANSNNTRTGVLGVGFEKGYFRARIKVNNKSRSLGHYHTLADAEAAYRSAKEGLKSE